MELEKQMSAAIARFIEDVKADPGRATQIAVALKPFLKRPVSELRAEHVSGEAIFRMMTNVAKELTLFAATHEMTTATRESLFRARDEITEVLFWEHTGMME